MYKHKGHKTQKCSLLCLYKTQIWFCALWFCGTKMNENPCVFVFFRVVFGVRYKHKTSFWLEFRVLTTQMSRNPFASSYYNVISWFQFWKQRFWLKKVQFCVLCIMVLYKIISFLMCLVEHKTQNGFVVLCLCTILNGICVVCVLYILCLLLYIWEPWYRPFGAF